MKYTMNLFESFKKMDTIDKVAIGIASIVFSTIVVDDINNIPIIKVTLLAIVCFLLITSILLVPNYLKMKRFLNENKQDIVKMNDYYDKLSFYKRVYGIDNDLFQVIECSDKLFYEQFKVETTKEQLNLLLLEMNNSKEYSTLCLESENLFKSFNKEEIDNLEKAIIFKKSKLLLGMFDELDFDKKVTIKNSYNFNISLQELKDCFEDYPNYHIKLNKLLHEKKVTNKAKEKLDYILSI